MIILDIYKNKVFNFIIIFLMLCRNIIQSLLQAFYKINYSSKGNIRLSDVIEFWKYFIKMIKV